MLGIIKSDVYKECTKSVIRSNILDMCVFTKGTISYVREGVLESTDERPEKD